MAGVLVLVAWSLFDFWCLVGPVCLSLTLLFLMLSTLYLIGFPVGMIGFPVGILGWFCDDYGRLAS